MTILPGTRVRFGEGYTGVVLDNDSEMMPRDHRWANPGDNVYVLYDRPPATGSWIPQNKLTPIVES
jgi:hypothetical protein